VRVNLVTLCGQQVPTLPHMLRHYRDLVDDIYIIVHALGEHDPIKERVQAIADEFGCGVYKTVIAEQFDPAYATQLYNEAMKERPDEWWIIADPDEFHLYFDDIRGIIDKCEAGGWSFVGGHFLDRFGPGGTLPKLEETDIWRQFPMAGVSRSVVTNRATISPILLVLSLFNTHFLTGATNGWAPSWKICLAKGKVRLGPGQHLVLKDGGVLGYPHKLGLVQVHHFKWDSTVLKRHLQTLDTIKRAEREGDDDSRPSYKTMYDYLIANDCKVNVADRRGLFADCPEPVFSAYPYWSRIVRHAPPFGLELDLTSWKSLMALNLWGRPVLGQLFWWLCRLAGRT
jgi:hypothetical protein